MKARRKKKIIRLLMFGDRYWRNIKAIERGLSRYDPKTTVVIHGDNGYDKHGRALWGQPDEKAVRGADKLSGKIARKMGFKVEVFSPDWSLGKIAGPLRNREMQVEGKPTEAICFHKDLSYSVGSIGMCEILDNAGIPWKQVKE